MGLRIHTSLGYMVRPCRSKYHGEVWGERRPISIQQHLLLVVPQAETESFQDTPFWLLSTSMRSLMGKIHTQELGQQPACLQQGRRRLLLKSCLVPTLLHPCQDNNSSLEPQADLCFQRAGSHPSRSWQCSKPKICV